MEESKKPALRFRGFTEDWEEHGLPEFVSFFNGLTYSPENACDEGTLVLRSSNVYNGEIVDADNVYVKPEVVNVPNVQKDDIIVVVRNGSQALLGKHARIKKNMPQTVIGAFMTGIRAEQSEFVDSLLDAPGFNEQVKENLGATINQITGYMFSQMKFMIPKEREQRTLGIFFEHLNELLTFHQYQYNKLQMIKKSCLEKMFPQNGKDVPEIRFQGSVSAWTQYKLGDIAVKSVEKNTGLQYIETFTNSAEYGIISQRDFFDHDISKIDSLSGYYVVYPEDFVYNPRISTTAPVGPVNRNKLGRTGVMSPLYMVLKTHDIDTTYLEYYFKSQYWYSFMRFNGDSGARADRFSIKDTVFMEMPIPYPSLEEQKKIGQFFTKLDILIDLHQCQLEKLQNLKKSLLDKMFV